jgi:hypothetical protein
LAGQICLAQGERVDAQAYAHAAYLAIGEGTSITDQRGLARLFGYLNQYASALTLLQQIANPGRYDWDTRMLLECANRLGKHRIVLDVCRALREAGEEDPRLLNNELNILQLYDRSAAIGVLQAHLARHPDGARPFWKLGFWAHNKPGSSTVVLLPPVSWRAHDHSLSKLSVRFGSMS